MITDSHPRWRWSLIHVPYDYLLSSIILLILMIKEIINRNGWPNTPPIHHHIFAMWVMIWMKERSNIYTFAMSQRWHQYGGPPWICQNHAYVFAHCRYLDLLVCPLCIRQTQLPAFADKWYQCFFWSSAGFLPKLFLYFSSPIQVAHKKIRMSHKSFCFSSNQQKGSKYSIFNTNSFQFYVFWCGGGVICFCCFLQALPNCLLTTEVFAVQWHLSVLWPASTSFFLPQKSCSKENILTTLWTVWMAPVTHRVRNEKSESESITVDGFKWKLRNLKNVRSKITFDVCDIKNVFLCDICDIQNVSYSCDNMWHHLGWPCDNMWQQEHYGGQTPSGAKDAKNGH